MALEARPGDPYAVWDEAGWAETFTHRDASLAPTGQHLVQAQLGLRPGEDLDVAVARVEALLDLGYRGWRDRVTWRRRARSMAETGAVDPPGTSWRDRPSPIAGTASSSSGTWSQHPACSARSPRCRPPTRRGVSLSWCREEPSHAGDMASRYVARRKGQMSVVVYVTIPGVAGNSS